MNISVTTTIARKTHSPAGKGAAGKTLCGKRIGERCPTVAARPTCKVCAVVFDQKMRGIVRIINDERETDREKNFAHGFAFFATEYARNNGMDSRIYDVFQEAGFELPDFDNVPLDPMNRETLNQIFGV